MKKYTMELKNDTFVIKVNGFFKEEDAKQYVQDFQNHLKRINPANYKLIVDA